MTKGTVDKPTHRVGQGVRARVHKHRLAQRQARQVKGKREYRYVIKVMRLNKEGGAVPLVRENQKMHRAFATRHLCNLDVFWCFLGITITIGGKIHKIKI
jgi:hypothetical protein